MVGGTMSEVVESNNRIQPGDIVTSSVGWRNTRSATARAYARPVPGFSFDDSSPRYNRDARREGLGRSI